jgi:acetylornithine deacetylase/succinyl-diaminopimelate desuccinylase-like protein
VASSSIATEAFRVVEAQVKKHYAVPTLPAMGTGATDMAYMRAKGMQCYGIGPAIDDEDAGRGFSLHGDQERISEAELLRFVRFHIDVVGDLAAAR